MPTTLTTNFPDLELQQRADSLTFRPGGHLRQLTVEQWNDFQNGKIGGLNPDFVWVLSPLGMAVEVIRGSAEHVLCCIDADQIIAIAAIAREEIAAEALAAEDARFEYIDFLEQHPVALTHILAIPLSQSKCPWPLQRAQRFADAVKKHADQVIAAHAVLGEIQ